MLIFVLAAAATLPLLSPDLAQDLKCVAVLGVAADPALVRDGAEYAAIVGANVMDTTGLSREAVRDMILAEVRVVRARGVSSVERDACVRQMRDRIKS